MSLNCVINDSGNFLLHTSRQVFWTDDGFFKLDQYENILVKFE